MRGDGRSAARQAGTPLIRCSQHWDEENEISYPRPFGLSHNPGIALTGTWCAPGIREGGGAGPVTWRKRGWKLSSEARARFAAPPHRQRPPRGPRRRARPPAGVTSGRPQVGEKPTIWLFERGTPGAIAEGWEGAILLLYEVPTQRPLPIPPQRPDGEIRAWQRGTALFPERQPAMPNSDAQTKR